MPRPVRIYWDSCAWIAYISQEKSVPLKNGRSENRFSMCLEILEAAKEGKYEIVTSAFTLAEVCKLETIRDSPADNLPYFLDRSYILVLPVDKSVGVRAQKLQTSGLVNLKPPDAIHLASAQRAGVSELHTFDDKMLKLTDQVIGSDSQPLKICKPGEGKPIGPLFEDSKYDTSS